MPSGRQLPSKGGFEWIEFAPHMKEFVQSMYFWVSQGGRMDYQPLKQILLATTQRLGIAALEKPMELLALAKAEKLSPRFALAIMLRDAFEHHHELSGSDHDSHQEFAMESLVTMAEEFENGYPLESAARYLARELAIPEAKALEALCEIISQRTYLMEESVLWNRLGPASDPEKMESLPSCPAPLLLEKLSLERSTHLLSKQLFFMLQSMQSTRYEFLARFPEYVSEQIGKSRLEILSRIHDAVSKGRIPSDQELEEWRRDLAASMVAGKEARAEARAAVVNSRLSFSTMGIEESDRFVEDISRSLNDLLKIVHPDKLAGIEEPELVRYLRLQSESLIELRKLAKSDVLFNTPVLMVKLQQIKRTIALIAPDLSQSGEAIGMDESNLRTEVACLREVESRLDEELAQLMNDEETSKMGVINATDSMHEEYREQLRISLLSLQQREEQICADPEVSRIWRTVDSNTDEKSP